MHREIEDMDNFLSKVKEVVQKGNAPPILLRSAEGLHEEQLAIYQMRTAFEKENYGKTINYGKSKSPRRNTSTSK